MIKQFFFLLACTPFMAMSQVGVGTNNVHPSAKLQIESTNKGFLQPRIALTGTTDVATIASPAAGLMVYNTATAGSGITAITPGIHYFDGAKWVRMEANSATTGGGGDTATFVGGNFLNPGTSNRVIVNNFGQRSNALKLADITLPAGKWEVHVATICEVRNWNVIVPQYLAYSNNTTTGTTTGNPVKMMYWLQSDSITRVIDAPSPFDFNLGGDTLFKGGAMFIQPIQNNTPNHSGSFFINNTSGAEKTYTLFAFEHGYQVGTNAGTRMPEYSQQFANRFWPVNRFYARKIN